MNYRQLQDEVVALRFDESKRASVKSWLNFGYTSLWTAADWHFKHVKGANLSVTAGDNTPTVPNDFGKSEGLYDNNGDSLTYLRPDEWRNTYLSTFVTPATPSQSYTVIDREIWLGPTPGGNATYTLSYLRRLSHIDGSTGLAAAGVMVNDSDSPIWDAEYDYLLVLQAAILGGSLLGDLDVQGLTQERDEILNTMRSDLVGGESGEWIGQWGNDPTASFSLWL